MRTFTPRCIAAARTYRAAVGTRWHVDETYLKNGGRWRYLYRAIDEQGHIVDVYLSKRRNAEAARTFFKRAIDSSDVTPTQVATDKAKSYPPALRAVLPLMEQRSSKYLNNRLERDHRQGCPLGQGRVRSLRRFKMVESAASFCRGHTLIRNLHQGFSRLTGGVAACRRMAVAWAALAATL